MPVVFVRLFENNNFISFNNCTFKHNYAESYSVVSLKIDVLPDISCVNYQNLVTSSNVHFRENQFISNYGKNLSLVAPNGRSLVLYITGPFSIMTNLAHAHRHTDLIFIQNMVVYIYGPLIISYNTAKKHSIWQFVKPGARRPQARRAPGFLELLLSANFCMRVCVCVRPRGYQ